MMNYIITTPKERELYHHGVLGMHWGIRRYQPYPKGHQGGKEIGEAKNLKKQQKARAKQIRNNIGANGRIFDKSVGTKKIGSIKEYNEVFSKIPTEVHKKAVQGIYKDVSNDPQLKDWKTEGFFDSDDGFYEYRSNYDSDAYNKIIDEYEKQAKKTVDEYLGKYGNIPLKQKDRIPYLDNTVGSRMVDTLVENMLDVSWEELARDMKYGKK